MPHTSGDMSGLVELAEQGRVDLVRQRLDAGANVDERSDDGRTPLLAALAEGSLETALLLLERGADPAACDHTGYTALHWAARSTQLVAMNLALANAPTIDPRDNDGRTPLSWAAQQMSKWLFLGYSSTGPIQTLSTKMGGAHFTMVRRLGA